MADAIRISGRRRWWSHCTSNLTTPTHDSTYVCIVIDILFINRKLNMKKWLQFVKSPTCVSNPYILQSVRNLQIQFRFTWISHWKFGTSLKKCLPSFVTLSYELLRLWCIHFEWRGFFCPQCIFVYLYLFISISIYIFIYLCLYIYIYISICICLFLFLMNVQLFESVQYFKVKLYITIFIKQLNTSDLTLHCVSCLIDNPSDVIFIFSNNFL